MFDTTVLNFEELVKSALILMPKGNMPHPFWVNVSKTFDVGPSSAKKICLHFGFDPEFGNEKEGEDGGTR